LIHSRDEPCQLWKVKKKYLALDWAKQRASNWAIDWAKQRAIYWAKEKASNWALDWEFWTALMSD